MYLTTCRFQLRGFLEQIPVILRADHVHARLKNRKKQVWQLLFPRNGLTLHFQTLTKRINTRLSRGSLTLSKDQMGGVCGEVGGAGKEEGGELGLERKKITNKTNKQQQQQKTLEWPGLW